MSELPVREAAGRLGISEQRVRVLLRGGRLIGHKVGRSWIADAELDPARRRLRGRPLGASSAWALLALLTGASVMWADPSVLSRLRRRTHDRPGLLRLLGDSEPRSCVHRWRILPSDLAKLASGYRLVPTGLSAGHTDLDIVSVGQLFDAYVDEKQLRKIERRFRPDRAPNQPNVILRVPSHAWILESFDQAPLCVVAADLLDDEDPRVAKAAARALESCARD